MTDINSFKEKELTKVYKAYEFRIYPTSEQSVFFLKTIGCVRLYYNTALERSIEYYKENKKFKIINPALLKKEFPFMKEVDSLALANGWVNLKNSYNNFFRACKKKGKKVGFPKFKSKKRDKASYTTNNVHSTKDTIRIEKGKLRLPKAGLVEIKLHRHLKGKIKSVTVKQTRSGKWFVSILTEQLVPKKTPSIPKDPKILGIDYSSHDFAVYSTGEIANPPKSYRKYEKKLKKESRRLSRKKQDSNRYEKQRIRLARVHEKIRNTRKNFIETESFKLASTYDVVVLEDLNLQSLSRTLKLGKSTMDNDFGMFRARLKRKMKEKGKLFVKTEKSFPSSQLCSNCGHKNPITKDLSVREWVCLECGTHHDRDINAAINLANYGRGVIENTAATVGIYARGDSVRPSEKDSSLKKAVIDEPRKVVGKDPASLLL